METLQAELEKVNKAAAEWAGKLKEIGELMQNLQNQAIQAEQQILLFNGKREGLEFALKTLKEGDNGGQADAESGE